MTHGQTRRGRRCLAIRRVQPRRVGAAARLDPAAAHRAAAARAWSASTSGCRSTRWPTSTCRCRACSISTSAPTQNLHRATATFLGSESPRVPFVIGLAGSVAVGKSTTSRVLQALLSSWPSHPQVDLVTTDGFLLPQRELEARGMAQRKGFPESYDVRRLVQFMADVKSGAARGAGAGLFAPGLRHRARRSPGRAPPRHRHRRGPERAADRQWARRAAHADVRVGLLRLLDLRRRRRRTTSSSGTSSAS